MGDDGYGRVIGKCSVAGQDIGAKLVSDGFAYAFVKYSSDYIAEEESARSRGVGVWRGDYQRPWVFETDDERIVGVLNDAVEDGPGWTFERLEEEVFSPTVLDALRLVTKRPEHEGVSEAVYANFVRRAKGNKIARRVKTADILDNLNASRLSALTE